MLVVETISKIRRAHIVHGESIKAIYRVLGVSRKVVRKVLRPEATDFHYEREAQPLPRMGPWRRELGGLLAAIAARSGRARLTLIWMFEELRGRGYAGRYDAVRRYYARVWERGRGAASAEAYVPLSFPPGQAYQFDWGHDVVLIHGATVTIKMAHMRLCHSLMLFVRAYPLEMQEMVLDAHDRAFPCFKGACTRGIYNNASRAFAPGVVRLDDLGGGRGGAAEPVPYAGRFDGFHAVPASASKTYLERFNNNRYSLAAHAVGRPVEVRAYADRIELRQAGRVVREHARHFGCDHTVHDPWHYVPVLARKTGTLRNDVPFKDWVLPLGLERVRRRLAGSADGDWQIVRILTTVPSDGLPAVEAACHAALHDSVHSAGVILNILARQREPPAPLTILASVADCTRYDSLRRAM